MTDVYLVYWSNNEPYEDYKEHVSGVFASYDDAVAYIEDKGYVPCFFEDNEDGLPDYFEMSADCGQSTSMWVRQMPLL